MKKGFTLVELLAVIVILALLATIAVPSAISIAHNIKKDMFCDKIDMILSDAERWGDSHMSQLKVTNPTNGEPICYKKVKIKDLIEQGIIKKENETAPFMLNPVTNNSMDDYEIGIYKKNKRAYAFYIETSSPSFTEDLELIKECQSNLRICVAGESELNAKNERVCIKRPTTPCP